MKRLWLSLVLLLGCSDDTVGSDASPPDAAMDAPAPDAPIDAPTIDASTLDGSTVDGGPTVFCTSDDTTGIVAGSRTIAPSTDFLALCNGEILLGDRAANQIVRENIVTGTVIDTYLLPSVPDMMALDRQTGVLFVSMPQSALIARIDLVTGVVTTLAAPTSALAVAIGPPGKIYVAGYDGTIYAPLYVIDAETGSVLATVTLFARATLMKFDSASNSLIMGDHLTLYRYSVDPSTGTPTFDSQVFAGSRCDELTLSPIGGHTGYACQGGSSSGMTPPEDVVDYSPADINQISGAWNVGGWPVGADFSPDGTIFASGNWTPELRTFTVSTHVQIGTYTPSITCSCGCSSPPPAQIAKVRYSRGGHLIYALLNCPTSGPPTSVHLSWFPVP